MCLFIVEPYVSIVFTTWRTRSRRVKVHINIVRFCRMEMWVWFSACHRNPHPLPVYTWNDLLSGREHIRRDSCIASSRQQVEQSSSPLKCLCQFISALLTGAESISVYEDVLRSVRYRLAKGSARFERRFRLSCSEMNGRYTSNELTLEVRWYTQHLLNWILELRS